MLIELNVKDIALIRKAHVEFDKGLNILTGETGTGKSIIIDSVMLALGSRVKTDVIRTGADHAYVELIFSVDDPEKELRLKSVGVEPDENGIIAVSRRISPGRSISRVNDETVTLSGLREITGELIDIYGQNEYHTLLDNKKHLSILDAFMEKKTGETIKKLRDIYFNYSDRLKAADSFCLDEAARLREEDILNYSLNEIVTADLKADEEEELSREYRRLNNIRKISGYLNSAYERLNNNGLEKALGDVGEALNYDENLKPVYDELLDVQSILDSALKDIAAYGEDMADGGEKLDMIESRLDLIRSLEAKYGGSIPEVLKYRDAATERLSELEDYVANRESALRDLELAEHELASACADLSVKRKQGAAELCGLIEKELKELGFDKARIDMAFREIKPGILGSDEVTFMASLNPGEPLKPLSEIASGGELSRVMLALKTVLARVDDMPTLIFDEIDAGISGRTAQRVAEKMSDIAKRHQVICVSHLPQIASMADTHFVIVKEEDEGRNITKIERLDEEGSLGEIARLLGGARITEAVYTNAAEMKKFADTYKEGRE